MNQVQVGVSLPTTRVNWPCPSELVNAGANWVRLILKGEITPLVVQPDREFKSWIDEATSEGLALFLDLPGSRPIVYGHEHGNGFRPGDEVVFIDRHAPFVRISSTAKSIRVSNMSAVVPHLKANAPLEVADGACVFMIEGLSTHSVQTRCIKSSPIDLFARGVTIPSDRIQYTSPTVDEQQVLAEADISAFSGVIVSFCESPSQIALVRSSGGTGTIVAKIESRNGARAARDIAAECDSILIGRADLRSSVGDEALSRCTDELIATAAESGTPIAVGSGVLESLCDGEEPSIADLADVWTLCQAGVAGILLAGSVSVRYPVRGARLLARLVTC